MRVGIGQVYEFFIQIEKEVDAVLADVIKNGVKADELERARASVLAGTVYMQDNQFSLADLFGVKLVTGSSFEEIRHLPEKIAKVNGEDIQVAARRWLQPEASVTGYLLQKQEEAAGGQP